MFNQIKGLKGFISQRISSSQGRGILIMLLTSLISVQVQASDLVQEVTAPKDIVQVVLESQQGVKIQNSQRNRYSYNFGSQFVNSRTSVQFQLTNRSNQFLTFQSAYVFGQAFDATHNCGRGLQINQSCFINIYFWPPFAGYYNGGFELNFVEDFFQIDLWGSAREY